MSKIDLNSLLAQLTDMEKARIILVFQKYMIADHLLSIRLGQAPMPPGGIGTVLNMNADLEDILEEAVRNGDPKRSLKAGMSDVFKGLPRVQKAASGARFNAFFRAHLPPKVFETLYSAAGLDVATLAFDPHFQTDWPEVVR